MLTCGADIRQFGLESNCVEEAAEKIVNYLYDRFEDESGAKAFALVQLFKVLRFDELDSDLRRYAGSTFDAAPDSRYVTLMGTAGDDHSWNDRRQTKQRQLVPADSEHLERRMPFLAHMLSQLELNARYDAPAQERRYLMEPRQKHFNVFHVPDAQECSLLMNDDVVRNYGVRSILGFGGMLNRGSMFSVAMFARSYLSRDCAELFNPLTLSTKNALIYATDFRMLASRRQPA